KWLILWEEKFRRLEPEQLEILLERCRNNLEWIVFRRHFWDEETNEKDVEFVKVLSKLSFPNLREIDLEKTNVGNYLFRALLGKNEKLRRVAWEIQQPRIFNLNGVVCENMRNLVMMECDDDVFRALTGRCPNLDEVYFEKVISNSKG